MNRPLIGISGMNSTADTGSALMAVRPTYLRALEAAGAVPVLIHLSDDLSVVRTLYERCDGILLPGGDDVDPACFGEDRHPNLGQVDTQRDTVEIALARWAREDQKPLLGICRGIQVLNVAFGGSLWQDLPSQRPSTIDHSYNTKIDTYDVEGHHLVLKDNTWLARQLGTCQILVNTMHHQAVKNVARGLRVAGVALDGLIEALESTTEHFIVAVQAHPEHLWRQAEPRWRRFFEGFVEHCRTPV